MGKPTAKSKSAHANRTHYGPSTLSGITGGMTGGTAIVAALKANGVETVFGLPGAQMYGFFDGLAQERDRIRTLGARHEQACGYMAFGYARSSGRPGVFAVVPGPGVLNTTAALVTALGTATPVLCITGQVPQAFLGRGRGHLHEIPDQLAMLKTVTKWSARIERAADAGDVINEAFKQMLTGRPGPVAVEMPWDVMGKTGFVPDIQPARLPPAFAAPPHEVARAVELITAAKAPMIFLGSGAQDASIEILELAERLGAPVTAFRGGRGIVAEDHPLGISAHAAWKLYPECDSVIAIGTRLELPTMRWTGMMTLHERLPGGRKLIRVDIDPTEHRRLHADAPMTADAQVAVAALLDALPKSKRSSPQRTTAIAAAKLTAHAELHAAVQPQMAYLDAIREVLPRDGFFVPELCQAGFTSYVGFPVLEPRTYVSEGFQGTLGFGFPTALGVKAQWPERAVVSITGDGGFLFAVQELATAKQYDLGVVIVLFNNNAYGNVRRDQQQQFGNRIIGADLVNPDFMMLAQAFDIAGYRVTSPEALKPVLAKAIAANSPALIEVVVPPGSEASPWPYIHHALEPKR